MGHTVIRSLSCLSCVQRLAGTRQPENGEQSTENRQKKENAEQERNDRAKQKKLRGTDKKDQSVLMERFVPRGPGNFPSVQVRVYQIDLLRFRWIPMAFLSSQATVAALLVNSPR